MVTQENHVEAHDHIDTFTGIRPVTDDITQAKDFGDTMTPDVIHHGGQGLNVSVNI
jgi:hypothetical protein